MCDMLLDASEWYELGLRFVDRLSHLSREKPVVMYRVSCYRIAICEKLLLSS